VEKKLISTRKGGKMHPLRKRNCVEKEKKKGGGGEQNQKTGKKKGKKVVTGWGKKRRIWARRGGPNFVHTKKRGDKSLDNST